MPSSRGSAPLSRPATSPRRRLGHVAKDAVDPIDFPTIIPQAYMQSGDQAPGYVGQSFISYCQTTTQPGCSSVGQTLTTPFPTATQNGSEGAGIGPVADG